MSASLARPKRAGEDFARSHHQRDTGYGDTDEQSTHKKPRFDLRNPSALAPDALEDDPILDADEFGRRGQQVRRKAVNLDGYDSDSENEGFSARVEQKAKRSRQKHDAEDDDMFAELQQDFGAEEVDADEAMRKNKKTVRFLRDDEIEGQVASSKSGGSLRADLGKGSAAVDVEEVESESDVPDEERANLKGLIDSELGAGSKKKHAPLLDAFNMRAEQEEGRFDDQGNYVRKAADPDAVYDTWLEGVSTNDIKRAREAAEKREIEQQERDKENDSIQTADLLRTIIPELQRGETILEALARLGKGLKRKPKWQTKKRKKTHADANGAGAEDVEMTEDRPEEAAQRKKIELITGAADMLMTRGQHEIYDTERELLTRQFRRETGQEWVDPARDSADVDESSDAPEATAMWEYRWSDARDGGAVHGPYDGPMMESWRSAGYFGEGVEFRRVGDAGDAGDAGDWSAAASFV